MHPRRRVQPRRPGLGGAARVRRRTSPTATRRSGVTRSTTRVDGVREWAIQNAELWVARLPRRRLAARCDARGLRRDGHRTCSTELAERVRAIDPNVARDLGDGDRRPAADRGMGPRRAVGRRAPPRGARAASPASTRATTSDYGTRRRRGARELVRPARPSPRGLRTEPRPGREPRRRRPAPRREAASGRLLLDPLARVRRCCSWARSTTSRHPFQFFTDHIDPGDRPGALGRAGGASSHGSRPSRERTCPTRRTSTPSGARSSTGHMPTRAIAATTSALLRLRAADPWTVSTRRSTTRTRGTGCCASVAATGSW